MINTDRLMITSVDTITTFNNADELEFILDEIQDTTISNTQENVDITGKQGAIIGKMKRNKAVTISGNNGFIVGGAMAAQTGSDVEQGTFKVRATEIAIVKSNKASIQNAAVGTPGTEIGTVYKRNSNGSLGEKFTQNATASKTKEFAYNEKELTFFEGDLKDGEEVVVFYDMEVEAARISNDSNTYSKTLKMYIDVTAQDNCDNVYHGQFIVPRADFTGEFDITMGSDPAVQAFNCTSLKDTCSGTGKLWDFIVW